MKPVLTLHQLEQEIMEININLRIRAETVMDDHESHALLQAAESTRIMLAWIHSAVNRNKK
jgi:hypothetical protein